MSNKILKKWALISEIIGGMAILITLVLLLTELQQNTAAIRVATYDDLVADLADYNLTQITDNELSEMRFETRDSGNGLSSISERHQYMLNRATLVRFQHYERAYIQWAAGYLDESQWERFRFYLCSLSGDPLFEEQVGSTIDRATSAEFTQYRRTQCGE